MNLDRLIEDDFSNQATTASMQNRLLTLTLPDSTTSSSSSSITGGGGGGGGGIEMPVKRIADIEMPVKRIADIEMPVKRIADGAAVDMVAWNPRVPTSSSLVVENGHHHHHHHSSSSSSSSSNQDTTMIIPDVVLHKPLSCYICRKPYVNLLFFYALLCPDCAEFNFCKREESADLTGRYVCMYVCMYV